MVLAQHPTAGLVQVPASQLPPQPQPNPIQQVSYEGGEEYPGRRRPRRESHPPRTRERFGRAAKTLLPAVVGIAASEGMATGQHEYTGRKHGESKDCDPMLKAVIEGAVATAGGLALAHHEKKKMQQRDRDAHPVPGPAQGGQYWESDDGEESEHDSTLKKLVEGGLATVAAVAAAHHEHKKHEEKKAAKRHRRRSHRRAPY